MVITLADIDMAVIGLICRLLTRLLLIECLFIDASLPMLFAAAFSFSDVSPPPRCHFASIEASQPLRRLLHAIRH